MTTTTALLYYVVWPVAFILLVITLFLLYKYPVKNLTLDYWTKVLYWLGLLFLITWPFVYLFFGNWGVAFGFVVVVSLISVVQLIMMCFGKRKQKLLLLGSFGLFTTWIIICSVFISN